MKALEILKRFDDKCESALGFNGECVIPLFEIKEAIEELEALQSNYEAQEIIIADLKKQLEPKSCETCKWKDYLGQFSPCDHCSESLSLSYEPKEQQ